MSAFEDKLIKLTSSDGESFEIAIKATKISQFISATADDEDVEVGQEFPVPNVKGTVLSKVCEFLNHYIEEPMQDIKKPLKSTDMKDAVQEWYATFINSVEQEMLFELVLAANFMAIEPLLHLSCATIASQVKGKTPEQIKEHFHIEREMVPVDEARIREENKWAEED